MGACGMSEFQLWYFSYVSLTSLLVSIGKGLFCFLPLTTAWYCYVLFKCYCLLPRIGCISVMSEVISMDWIALSHGIQ